MVAGLEKVMLSTIENPTMPLIDGKDLSSIQEVSDLVEKTDVGTIELPDIAFIECTSRAAFVEQNVTYRVDVRSTIIELETALKEGVTGEARLLPENGGKWIKEKGDSEWEPDDDLVPKKHNEEGKSWREIKDKYDFDGIPFNEGEPDFTEVSEATVIIDDFSANRNANFTQADEACAKQWNEQNREAKTWTAADVREYRKENGLSWHERSDQKNMDLVPSVIHGNIPHSGGISAAKKEAA